MNKRILVILGILALLVAGVLIWRSASTDTRVQVDTATTTVDQVPDNIPTGSSSQTPTLASQAWDTFERYMKAAKAHDLETLKTLSHQISPACADPAKRTECNALMDSAYAYAEPLKEEQFKTIWADSKQIILLGNYTIEGEETSPGAGMFRPVLYFTRSGDAIKLLAMNPSDGAIIVDEDMTFAEKKARLLELVKDSDEDGIADKKEECIDEDAECEKTNPQRRDTDGDGWWDGIEAHFR